MGESFKLSVFLSLSYAKPSAPIITPGSIIQLLPMIHFCTMTALSEITVLFPILHSSPTMALFPI